MNLDEALAVRRYFGGNFHLTENQRLCLKEADRTIHRYATEAFNRFVAAMDESPPPQEAER